MEKPQKGRQTRQQALPTRTGSTVVDTMMHRAGSLRMVIIGLFAFIHTFRDKYKVVLEFAGDNHVDITETLLMRVRIVLRNNTKGGEE